jgi:enoyl-CoA hydratase/carnithine racemase
MTSPQTGSSVVAQTSPTPTVPAGDRSMVFETLRVRREGGLLFVEIAAPPMNLLGPELVRDLVAFIQRAEADNAIQVLVFKSANPDYFISHVDVTGSRNTARRRLGRHVTWTTTGRATDEAPGHSKTLGQEP